MDTLVPDVIVDDFVEVVPATPNQQLLYIHVLDFKPHLKWLPCSGDGELQGKNIIGIQNRESRYYL